MQQNITPLPWSLYCNHVNDQQGELLASTYPMAEGGDEISEANAAFIVKACNAHNELTELAKMIISPDCSRTACVVKARAALAAAGAE